MEKISVDDFIKKEGSSLAAAEKYIRVLCPDIFSLEGSGTVSISTIKELMITCVQVGFIFGTKEQKKENLKYENENLRGDYPDSSSPSILN